ncbi:MAG: hypothetical protein HKM87_05220 [Ignavibacteriaceae bacterium]|nr:hypothetical protein [Ignavibacteriaceae bacterium]
MATKSMRILFTFLFLCGLYPAYYAQQIESELQVLSKGADVILIGEVTEQASSWNENKTRIYTKATIQVDEYIKGSNTQSIVTVKYLGGEVGEIGEMYSHMPRFEDNEEVLVFLKKGENNTDYKVFSGEVGKIRVVNDPQTGEKVTTSNVRVSSLKAQIKRLSKEQ